MALENGFRNHTVLEVDLGYEMTLQNVRNQIERRTANPPDEKDLPALLSRMSEGAAQQNPSVIDECTRKFLQRYAYSRPEPHASIATGQISVAELAPDDNLALKNRRLTVASNHLIIRSMVLEALGQPADPQLTEALRVIDAKRPLLKNGDPVIQPLINKAFYALEDGHLTEARKLANQILIISPREIKAHTILFRVALRYRLIGEAERIYQEKIRVIGSSKVRQMLGSELDRARDPADRIRTPRTRKITP
jgi:hypothetical protein